MTLSVGLGILTAQVPPEATFDTTDELEATIELAVAAEDLGFDSCWVSEHHFAPDGYLPSVLPVLAAIAVRTRRIGLGSAAVLAPFHHPLRLAEDAAVVDQLSHGRLQIGVANGWRAAEFEGFGVRRAERAGRLEECVAILRQAWGPGAIRFDGRYFQIEDVQVYPKPAHRIPVWIGASADAAVVRAGRLADGYIASSAPLSDVARLFSLAVQAAAGRPLKLAVMLDVALDELGERAYRYKQEVYRRWHAGNEAPAPWPPSDNQADELLISGSPFNIVRRLRSYIETVTPGDVTLIVRLHFPGMPAHASLGALNRFAVEVLPRLRHEVE